MLDVTTHCSLVKTRIYSRVRFSITLSAPICLSVLSYNIYIKLKIKYQNFTSTFTYERLSLVEITERVSKGSSGLIISHKAEAGLNISAEDEESSLF